MKNLKRILFGIIFILFGVAIALAALGILPQLFFDGWWTLFIILPSLIWIITSKGRAGYFCLGTGVLILLAYRNIIPGDVAIKLVLPLIIVSIGLRIVFGSLSSDDRKIEKIKKKKQTKEASDNSDTAKADARAAAANSYTSAFSGQNIKLDGEIFDGTSLTATFGGIKLDLSGAVISEDCVIDVCAVFGGVDIILPQKVNVKVRSNSVLGGMSNKRKQNASENAPTVYVKGMCMFGGVEIK